MTIILILIGELIALFVAMLTIDLRCFLRSKA
jgi:hypothetical protein